MRQSSKTKLNNFLNSELTGKQTREHEWVNKQKFDLVLHFTYENLFYLDLGLGAYRVIGMKLVKRCHDIKKSDVLLKKYKLQ